LVSTLAAPNFIIFLLGNTVFVKFKLNGLYGFIFDFEISETRNRYSGRIAVGRVGTAFVLV
jgi:hypothetical protein